MKKSKMLNIIKSVFDIQSQDINQQAIDFEVIQSITDKNETLLGEEFLNTKYDTHGESQSYMGFTPIQLTILKNGQQEKLEISIKGKDSMGFSNVVFSNLLKKANIELSVPHETVFIYKEFKNCHLDETNFYMLQHDHPTISHYMPKYYGHYRDEVTDRYYLFLELMKHATHLNDNEHVDNWQPVLFDMAMDGIAHLHAEFYDKDGIGIADWAPGPFSTQEFYQSTELWEKIIYDVHDKRPDLVSEKAYQQHLGIINDIPNWFEIIAEQPKTLVHGDYNPRNIGFIKHEDGDKVVILDWESVRWGLPQYDLAQFLLYSFSPDNIVEKSKPLIEKSRVFLENHSGKTIAKSDWLLGLEACLKSHLVNRNSLVVLLFLYFPNQNAELFFRLYPNTMALLNSSIFSQGVIHGGSPYMTP